MTKTLKYALSMVAAGAVALSLIPGAQAAPITGSVSFQGVVQMNGSANTASEVISWGSPTVGVGTGSFVGLTYGTAVTFGAPLPWSFTTTSTINNFWSVGGFSFALANSYIANQGNNQLSVNGSGTLTGNGYDDTAATFNFSTQGSVTTVTFSTTTSAVPEAGTTAILLGFGLIGLAAFAQFRKQAVA